MSFSLFSVGVVGIFFSVVVVEVDGGIIFSVVVEGQKVEIFLDAELPDIRKFKTNINESGHST